MESTRFSFYTVSSGIAALVMGLLTYRLYKFVSSDSPKKAPIKQPPRPTTLERDKSDLKPPGVDEKSNIRASGMTDNPEDKFAQCAGGGGEAFVEVSEREIRETLVAMETSVASMQRCHAQVLVSLLTSRDYALLEQVLVYVSNAAAFTANQNLLRDIGGLQRLQRLLRAHVMAIRVGGDIAYPRVVTSLATAISNLALNEANQHHLKECIPGLIDFVCMPTGDSGAAAPSSDSATRLSVQLSALKALTNLSLTDENHTPYTRLVQQLYQILDLAQQRDTSERQGDLSQRHVELRMQALRVLVNLASNQEFVPYLLAAKAPACALALIDPCTDSPVLLRWLTLLSHVMVTARDRGLSFSALPTDYKAASPETLYSALYSLHSASQLRSRVFVLCKHEDEEVRQRATEIYACLQ